MRPNPSNGQVPTQLAMLPARAYEISLKVGVMPADDHCQLLIEVRNATDGTLLLMESVPHVLPEHLLRTYQVIEKKLYEILSDLSGPFPSL